MVGRQAGCKRRTGGCICRWPLRTRVGSTQHSARGVAGMTGVAAFSTWGDMGGTGGSVQHMGREGGSAQRMG
eukprot:366488-Chlamydomonas_euryale.AAC.8